MVWPMLRFVMVIDLKQSIGANIRANRLALGLTQEQLAEKIGRAWETVSNIERGKNPPSVETLRDISLALSISIDELIEGTGRDVSVTRFKNEAAAMTILRSLRDDEMSTALRLLEALADRRTGSK